MQKGLGVLLLISHSVTHARYVEHMHYEDLNNGQCKNRFHCTIRMYSDNAQKASQRGKNICHASTSLYYHVLTSSVCDQLSTDARPNGIFLNSI